MITMKFAKTPGGAYPYLLVAFVACLIVSTITATKGVMLFPALNLSVGLLTIDGLNLDGAFWIFPLSYVIGDVISEVYGFKAMRRAVMVGFVTLIIVALSFKITVAIPAAPWYDNQDALASVVGVVPQILLASLTAFAIGELLNSYVLVKMKKLTGENQLWARLLGSTVVGEFVDTVVFCVIAASAIGITTFSDVLNYVVVGFVWKTLVEVLVMPLTYVVIGWIKKIEDYDIVATPVTAN